MTTRKIDGPRTPRRGRGDDGAALIEFVLVSILLFTLLFGIIIFGLVLSFRQDMTRAAAEGARGGAVAIPTLQGQSYDDAATLAATSAVNDAVKEMNGRFRNTGCDTPGISCGPPRVIQCPSQPSYKCVTVTVTYDYDHYPIYADLPIISAFLPNTMKATSVARINS